MNENNKTYKTIGDVAKILNLVDKKTGKLSTHTIRFWEKNLNKLSQIFFLVKEDIMTLKQSKF